MLKMLRSSGRLAAIAAAFSFFVAASAQGQTKVFYPYWVWPNVFTGSATFTPGTGSQPTWKDSFDYSSYNLYGYPASIRGWHYGYNPAGDTLFPKQISTMSHIPVTFSYSSSGSNMAGDFTYDLFLRNDNQKSTPELEVMVWGGNDSYPISTTGSPIVSNITSFNGQEYDLYYGYNSAAGYGTYSFLPHRTGGPTGNLPTGGSINGDLLPLLKLLNGRQYYSSSMYLDVIEAGCEITRGDGSISATAFSADAY